MTLPILGSKKAAASTSGCILLLSCWFTLQEASCYAVSCPTKGPRVARNWCSSTQPGWTWGLPTAMRVSCGGALCPVRPWEDCSPDNRLVAACGPSAKISPSSFTSSCSPILYIPSQELSRSGPSSLLLCLPIFLRHYFNTFPISLFALKLTHLIQLAQGAARVIFLKCK